MALSFSTGLRNFVGTHGSYKRALQGGVMRIYSGSAPATADAAYTGTLLCTVSLASGTHTPEVLSTGTVTLAGSSGAVTGITVNGIEVLGTTCTFVDTLTNLATLVAATINAYQPTAGVKYIATSSAAVVTITALPGTGTVPNGYVVSTSVSGSVTKTDVNLGTGAAGVASVNGLTYGDVTAGVLSKSSGVWSGVVAAAGTAGYFRIHGSVVDTAAVSSTTLPRIQGTCGVSGADYNMSSTTLSLSATHTVDSFALTFPAA